MRRFDDYTGKALEDYDELAYGFSIIDHLDDEMDEDTIDYLLREDDE